MRPAALALLLFSISVHAQTSGDWIAGRHYTVLPAALPTDARRGEVEVIEVFSYTCIHCYRLEPQLREWLRQKPDYIHFTRLSAVWDDQRRALTHLHYVVEAVGRPDLQSEILESLHRDPKSLFTAGDAEETYRQQLAFAAKYGIDAGKFKKAYGSQAVLAKVSRAAALLISYRIENTPTMVINGKYTVSPGQARDGNKAYGRDDFTPLLKVTSDLAAREHRAMASATAARQP